MNTNIAGFFAIATSLLMTSGLYAQVWKIYKTKSAKDFSLLLIIALVLNELAWLNYGVRLGELPVWIVPVLNLPAIIGGVPGYVKYRHPPQSAALSKPTP